MEENYGHKPVLLHECLGALAIKPDGIYVDGTLGRAGHSLEIVRRLTTGRLIALDRDETAIEAANRRLGDYLDKVRDSSPRTRPSDRFRPETAPRPSFCRPHCLTGHSARRKSGKGQGL